LGTATASMGNLPLTDRRKNGGKAVGSISQKKLHHTRDSTGTS